MLSTDHLEVIEFSLTPTPNELKNTLKLPEIDMLEKLRSSYVADNKPDPGTGHQRPGAFPEDQAIDTQDLTKLIQNLDPSARPHLRDHSNLTTNTDTESYGSETLIIEEGNHRKTLSAQSELQPLQFDPNGQHSFMTMEDDDRPPECPTLFKTDTNPHRSHRPTMEIQDSGHYPGSDMDVVLKDPPVHTHTHHPQYAEYQSPPHRYDEDDHDDDIGDDEEEEEEEEERQRNHYRNNQNHHHLHPHPGRDGSAGTGTGTVYDDPSSLHRRDRPSETPSEEELDDFDRIPHPKSNHMKMGNASSTTMTTQTTMPSVSTFPPMGHTVDRREMDRAIGGHTNGMERPISSSSRTGILDVLSDSSPTHNESCLSTTVCHKLTIVMFLLSACILSTHLLCDEESAKYKIMAAVIGNILSAFFCFLFHSLWKSQKLHQVKVITSTIDPYYGALSLPTQIEEDQTRPIFSISELVGFRGSSLYLMFLISSVGIAIITSLAVMIRWVELHEAMIGESTNNVEDDRYPMEVVAIALALCGPLIRFFDLNAYDEVAGWRILDIADLMLSFMGTFAFAVQSEYSSESVWMTMTSLVLIIMWIAMTRYYSKDLSIDLVKVHSEIPYQMTSNWTEEALFRKVHIISLRCVAVEALARMCCLVTIFLYVWNLEDVVMV